MLVQKCSASKKRRYWSIYLLIRHLASGACSYCRPYVIRTSFDYYKIQPGCELCMCRQDLWTGSSFLQSPRISWSVQTERRSSLSSCSWDHLMGHQCIAAALAVTAFLEPQSYPEAKMFVYRVRRVSVKRTSKPWSLPMSIMSFAWLGTTVITWKACSIAWASSCIPARWLCFRIASRSMWYFVNRCIGFIRRSVKRNLNPCFNLISCNILVWTKKKALWTFALPQNKYQYVLRQCILILACSGSRQHTFGTFFPTFWRDFRAQQDFHCTFPSSLKSN